MQSDPNRDRKLIEDIRSGDRNAFRLLFDAYYQFLLAVAMNLLKDLQAAKDVVQDVFFQIWKKREQIEIRASIRAYLKRAVINRALNQIKSGNKNTGIDHAAAFESRGGSAQQHIEASQLKDALQQTLDKLPERCRQVFILRRMEGRPHKEIAEMLNISPKTVENQMTKALKALKEAAKPFLDT